MKRHAGRSTPALLELVREQRHQGRRGMESSVFNPTAEQRPSAGRIRRNLDGICVGLTVNGEYRAFVVREHGANDGFDRAAGGRERGFGEPGPQRAGIAGPGVARQSPGHFAIRCSSLWSSRGRHASLYGMSRACERLGPG